MESFLPEGKGCIPAGPDPEGLGVDETTKGKVIKDPCRASCWADWQRLWAEAS